MGNIYRGNCFSCYNDLMRECVSCHVLQFHINKHLLTIKTNVFIIRTLLIYNVTDVQCLNASWPNKKHPWNKYALAQHWPNGSVVQTHVGPMKIQHTRVTTTLAQRKCCINPRWPNIMPTSGANVGPLSKMTGQRQIPTLAQRIPAIWDTCFAVNRLTLNISKTHYMLFGNRMLSEDVIKIQNVKIDGVRVANIFGCVS